MPTRAVRPWLCALVLMTPGGCNRPGEAFGLNDAVDCDLGFRQLVRSLELEKGSLQWEISDQAVLLQHDSTREYYIVTRPGHPAHPAVIQRSIVIGPHGGINLLTEGCAYGDRVALNQVLAEYKRFDAAMRAEMPSYDAPDRSPTARGGFSGTAPAP